MSSTTQPHPVVTLYPSTKEDFNAYMAAIRQASSVRHKRGAQKVGKPAVNANSYGRHHPNFPPPPPANLKPVPILNQTSSASLEPPADLNQTISATLTSNTTKPGFVHPRDGHPPPSHSMSTGSWPLLEEHASAAANLYTLANAPTGATPEALKQNHGHLPPPDPSMTTADGPISEDTAADILADVKPKPLEQHQENIPPPEPLIGSTQAPPGNPVSERTRPIPIDLNQDPYRSYVPDGIPPQCQLYVANTDANKDAYTVCPVTKRTTNPIYNFAGGHLHFGKFSNSHILATRDTATCDAPTSSHQRLACGKYDAWFVFAFLTLFCIISFAWMRKCMYRTRRLDEEDGDDTWPRPSDVSTYSSEAKSKAQASRVSTNRSESTRRESVRKAHGKDQCVHEERGANHYELVAWRRPSHCAARANVERRVEHDAGPVAVLPGLQQGIHHCGQESHVFGY